MKSRAHSHVERDHLQRPRFLERYFQKKAVWLITIALFACLYFYIACYALRDLFQIEYSQEFNLIADIVLLVGIPLLIPSLLEEYRFYQKMLWSKPASAERIMSSTEITVKDIHMVLDCDGMTHDDITAEDTHPINTSISAYLMKHRGATNAVAQDFTRHYVDEENIHESKQYHLAVYDDLVEHVQIDKSNT